MVWSTMFRTFLHFYFNYHYGESLISYIHSSFARRVQFSLRILISFLVGGFIAYNTSLNKQLSQEFLIPLISVFTIQETFGLTVASCYQIVLGLVPTAIFLFVVQKIGLGYHDYLAAEFVLIITTFFISMICTQSRTRKMPLVLCAIFFATIVNQPVISSTFIFVLLEEFIVGMSIGILISLTVFPVFATMDIENRVNYCLINLQEMQRLIIQGFLCQDKMSAQVSLSRVSTIEQMIRVAINPLPMKLIETRFEPSRLLQRIFNRRRRNIIDLTIKEQEDLIRCWFIHICSMKLMVNQCQFNDYHNDLTHELEESLLRVCSCQLVIISTITKCSTITKDEFIRHISDFDQSVESLRSVYNEARFRRVEHALESTLTIGSEDHLSHSFFLLQLYVIAKLFKQIIPTNSNKSIPEKKKLSLKERLLPKWSRLLPKWSHLFSALKCTIIVGVGSIFVMVPSLANAFENGQWIFITLCMTQGDSVGGAFTTMKMRLFGTLLGSMWAYITYLSAHDDVYKTFGMLVPWILVFGYIRPSPKWSYAAIISSITPILINLGRIPYGNALPAGNFALLRIEENLVGIGVACILTLIIFPVFAVDLLKDNIQTTLQSCYNCTNSMDFIYNQFYSPEVSLNIDQQEEENKKSSFQIKRDDIYQLITAQRALIEHSSSEPSLWCLHNNFSTNGYKILVQQEIDIFQLLFCINTTLIHLNEYSIDDQKQIENIQIYSVHGQFFSKFQQELSALCNQLSDCFNLWSSYFAQTQTKFHRFFSRCVCSKTKLSENDLFKHEKYLIELHKTVIRLQKEHQDGIQQILDYYLDRLTQGDTTTNFIHNNQTNFILTAISSIYFSTSELAGAAIALGTSIHAIFELETTHRYVNY